MSVVLGSYGSGVSIAGSPYFADAGIAAIGITCTNPQVTDGNTHYFRICFLDPFQGTVLANYAFKTLGVTSAYCLAELGNEYDVGLCHYFAEAFEALGGTVVSETFPTGNVRLHGVPEHRDNAWRAGVLRPLLHRVLHADHLARPPRWTCSIRCWAAIRGTATRWSRPPRARASRSTSAPSTRRAARRV